MLTEWWSALDVMQKILWSITLSASLIFIVQSVLTFLGADASSDMDFDIGDVASADMNLYTFRNFINFFLGFGWTSVLMYDTIRSRFLLYALSIVVGILLVIAVMYLFKLLSSMQQSGNIDVYSCAVGCHGTVYLLIPGKRSGEGKVQISINGSIREYNALTDGEELKTGTPVTVVGVLDQGTLLVSKM